TLSKKYINFTYIPMRNAQGEVDTVIRFAYDLTEQVVNRQRIALFSKVNANLAIIQNETLTLYTVANRLTSSMCDYCLIDRFTEDEALHSVASSHQAEAAPLYSNEQEQQR